MITQSCIIKGIEDIEFISASNKLKYFVEKGKTSYNERKNGYRNNFKIIKTKQ